MQDKNILDNNRIQTIKVIEKLLVDLKDDKFKGLILTIRNNNISESYICLNMLEILSYTQHGLNKLAENAVKTYKMERNCNTYSKKLLCKDLGCVIIKEINNGKM